VKQNCIFIFFFRAQSHTIIYTLSLHDALPISDRSETDERSESPRIQRDAEIRVAEDRDQRRREVEEGEIGARDGVEPQERRHLRSEEHTSELQSLAYLVCRLLLEKKKKTLLTY